MSHLEYFLIYHVSDSFQTPSRLKLQALQDLDISKKFQAFDLIEFSPKKH